MLGDCGCWIEQNVDIHSMFMTDGPLHNNINQHCEELVSSFQTLDGRLLIGYYMALFKEDFFKILTWTITASKH